MDHKTCLTLLRHYQSTYHKVHKKEKQQILTTLMELTHYNRKYLVTRLAEKLPIAKVFHHRRKESKYQLVLKTIKKLWLYGKFPCSVRLIVMMPIYIEALERFQEISLTSEEKELITHVSARTLDRHLKVVRQKLALKARTGTKPGSLLKSQIPIKMWTDWDHTKPGFLEIDSVHHNGGNPSGQYCYTVSLEDVATGWHENQSHWGKSELFTTTAIDTASRRFPFVVLGLDFDTGGEFVNWHLKRYCDQRKITYTRARQGMKNDQCFVEQSNWSQVREYVGYQRFDSQEQTQLLNQLYVVLSDYLNYFQAKERCIKKVRNGARVKRKFETRTPYQRVLENTGISQKTKRKLTNHFLKLNPKTLLKKIVQIQKLLDLSVRK